MSSRRWSWDADALAVLDDAVVDAGHGSSDVPMVKTAINAHADTPEAIRATIAKIMGRSEFQGTFNENVFCDSFDTRR